MEQLSEIQQFYKNKTVFITGGTGLMGKVLVEKLLRSCSQLCKIILPIRGSKSASFKERACDYFNDKLFDKIKSENPEVLQKVIIVNSNLEQERCGFNCSDYNTIISTVNIIFHSAASVNFKAHLSVAINCNIKVTKNIINIAKEMEQLQGFIHLSTLWSHGIMDYTEEKVFKFSYDPEFLINLVDNIDHGTLRRITPHILNDWPNTYVFTKQISEVQITKEEEQFPVAIFRVPGVTPIYREPISGWANSIQGISALGIGIASGSVKVVTSTPETNCDMLPADLIVNALITVGWYTGTNKRKKYEVYNYGSPNNSITKRQYFESFLRTKYPLECTIWTPGYINANSERLFEKYNLLYHTIPAYICDTFLKIFNQKPRYQKLMKRNHAIIMSIAWFLLTHLKFEFKNIPTLWKILSEEDKHLFNFDVDSLNWEEYFDIFSKSVKELLKENFDNMDKCEARRYLKLSKKLIDGKSITLKTLTSNYIQSSSNVLPECQKIYEKILKLY